MSAPADANVFHVGSRKSELALIQTNHVIGLLQNLNPAKRFKVVTMDTKGDRILNKALPKIGEKSLFTEELENALERGRVDFLVHSLKDLPTTLREGLAIGAILAREDPRDAVVMRESYKGCRLEELPEGSVVGTSSLRRAAYLARNLKGLRVETIRGNLNTRFKKLDEEGSVYAAIILAVAGLKRMNLEHRISQYLSASETLYCVGQGALGIECRESDSRVLSLLEPLSDLRTTVRCVAERSYLKYLGGGCSAPVGVASTLEDKRLSISGAVLSLDGKVMIQDTLECKLYLPDEVEADGEPARKCPYREPRTYTSVVPGRVSAISLYGAEKLGKDLAESLIKRDALEVMAEARREVLSGV